MAATVLINGTKPPTDAELTATLGAAKPVWDELLIAVAQECGATVREWKCYSPKSGWALRAKRKDRTIIWLTPSRDCFEVLFILGEAAMTAARHTRLPQHVLRILKEAPKYPEGSGVRVRVKSMRDLAAVKKLAAVKFTY